MNLIIKHRHDMGRHNSAYGFHLPTPRMAQLGHESIRFRNAHAMAPTRPPSRAAMLTGYSAHEVGMLGLAHRGWSIEDMSVHLARRFSQAEFHTACAGVQHEFVEARNCPYDERLRPMEAVGGSQDLHTSDQISRWLERRDIEHRFFPWAGFFWPHQPFVDASHPRFPRSSMRSPSVFPDDCAGYAASIEHTDFCDGQVIEAVDRPRLTFDTVAVLTTDHGLPFPFMKCNLPHHGTGVTLVVRDPRYPDEGRANDALVSHEDLVATVLDLLELPEGFSFRGVSLCPLMDSKCTEVRPCCYAEVTYHGAYEPMRSVRTRRWCYIRSWYKHEHPPMANRDRSSCNQLLQDLGWGVRRVPHEQLYDLKFDPNESLNLAADPEYDEIRRELTNELKVWVQLTRDPLIDGPIPLSPTGITNTHQAVDWERGPFKSGPHYLGREAIHEYTS